MDADSWEARQPDTAAACGGGGGAHGQHAREQPLAFQFEDVDCKALKAAAAHEGPAASVAGASPRPYANNALLLDDGLQSPLPAIKETGEIMAKLVLMYVVLEVAAGLVKGQSPLRHLLLAAVHLKIIFQAMLAPLSMMCSGFALAMVQYSLLTRKQQRAAAAAAACSHTAAAAAGSKGKAHKVE